MDTARSAGLSLLPGLHFGWSWNHHDIRLLFCISLLIDYILALLVPPTYSDHLFMMSETSHAPDPISFFQLQDPFFDFRPLEAFAPGDLFESVLAVKVSR